MSTLITIILTILSISITLTQADPDTPPIVTQLCSTTYAPVACISCLNVPEYCKPLVTELDVIYGLLDCADQDAIQLDLDILDLIDQADNVTKPLLYDCAALLQGVNSDNVNARDYVQAKRYDIASNFINADILPKFGRCSGLFTATTIPPKVFSGVFVVEGDYKLVSQVLAGLA